MSDVTTTVEEEQGDRSIFVPARSTLHAECETKIEMSPFSAAWGRIERVLERAGDWLNPILVKETRQALKSFQFTVTFVLVLVACWVVTIGGVAMIGPQIYYAAAGGSMLWAYYTVLAFPLAVVVPYSAFRSLASEREDNTYDLLSITTLKPRQIISGKLGSSIVQMAVYFSAITPCLAFTYLLRGVDVPTIAILLVYTFFGSLGLAMLGILLATLTEQRFGQVFVSVGFVAVLMWIFYMTVRYLASAFIQHGYSFVGSTEFWVTTAALATLYVTTFALAFFAAAGRITFTSENRSTPLRIGMLVQQAALVGWMGAAWILSDYELGVVLFFTTFAAIYWYVMGTMLSAERPTMSERVKRRLPTSFAGRLFLTWLNPGPGTGYLFVVANATTMVLIGLLAIAATELGARGTFGWPGTEVLFYLLVIGWAYLVAYLGLGWLVIRALRRLTVVTMFAAALIHFLLVLAGSGVTTSIQWMSVEMRHEAYSFLQVANPIWSLYYVANSGISAEAKVLLFVVPAAAVCMLLVNLPHVVRELNQLRIAPPQRVVEDEAELHPPPEARPSSPWDVPD